MLRLMYVFDSGEVWFQGRNHLVKEPEEARHYEDFDEALDQVRDTVHLSLTPITQVRILGVNDERTSTSQP